MTVRELIKHLRTFDENHIVRLEIEPEYALTCIADVNDAQFKHGECRITGFGD